MSASAKSSVKRYRVLRGIRYPKSKTVRDRIRAGEATSADVGEWVRVEEGKKVALPPDMATDFLDRKAIEEA